METKSHSCMDGVSVQCISISSLNYKKGFCLEVACDANGVFAQVLDLKVGLTTKQRLLLQLRSAPPSPRPPPHPSAPTPLLLTDLIR